MSQQKNNNNASAPFIIGTLIFSIAYVAIRYHVFGQVPLKDFPFYVLNKGISLAAFILLTFNFTFGPLNNVGVKMPERWLNARKTLGITGFLLIVVHVFMSLLLFKPTVYAKFFEADGTMTLLAGLSMLAGVIAFVFLWVFNMSFQTYLRDDKAFIELITSRKFLMWALTIGAFHLFFMGYKGWLNPSGWHGGMPPVTLVAFALFIVGYTINIFGRK